MRVFNNKAASFLAALLFLLSAGAFAQQPYLMPLSWDDPMFTGMTEASEGGLVTNTISHYSIVNGNGGSAFTCDTCTATIIRIDSREGPRCQNGDETYDRMYVNTWYVTDDHADGLQCYVGSPTPGGVHTIKNSTFQNNPNVHTSVFSADGFLGSFVFDNLLLMGGGSFGIRIPDDGGTSVSLKDVFVNSAGTGTTFKFGEPVSGYSNLSIVKWENVRYATIVNGHLVPGAEIACPTANSTPCPTNGTKLAAPTNLAAPNGGTEVTFTWSAGASYPGGTTYELTANLCKKVGLTSTTTTCAVGSAGNPLHAHVRAIPPAGYNCATSGGTCPSNYALLATTIPSGTPDTEDPSTPTNPSATAVSATQIDLSWTASTDNVGIAGYEIRRCSGASCTPSTVVQSTTGTGTTWSDTGLTASTLYRYTIQARDAVPNYSAQSTVAQGLSSLLSAPTNLRWTPR